MNLTKYFSFFEETNYLREPHCQELLTDHLQKQIKCCKCIAEHSLRKMASS